jgi:peptide/nickel transport system permease protein
MMADDRAQDWTRSGESPAPSQSKIETPEDAAWRRMRSVRRPASSFVEHLPRSISFWVGVSILLFFGAVAVYALVRYAGAGTWLTYNPVYAAYVFPPGPSADHPFGINNVLGIDMLEAVVRATPWDVGLVGGIVVSAAVIGLFVGCLSAAGIGGRAELTLSSVTDVLATIPAFFLVFVFFLPIAQYVSSEYFLLLFGVLFVLVLWPYHARAVRGRARQIEREPFVESARASGASRRRILLHHILPNSYLPVLAQIPVDVMVIFFALTVFPYVHCQNLAPIYLFSPNIPYTTPLPSGPGGNPPSALFPEWGNLLAVGACYGWAPIWGANFWWMYMFPLLAIVLFSVGIALMCDGLERRSIRI